MADPADVNTYCGKVEHKMFIKRMWARILDTSVPVVLTDQMIRRWYFVTVGDSGASLSDGTVAAYRAYITKYRDNSIFVYTK